MPESETNGLSSRKRTASISTKDANKVPQVQDMSLNATSNSYASTFVGRSGETRELICLCTKAPKVPRPRNAFILYRQHHQASVAAQHPALANPEISKVIGEQWREQPDEVKDSWKRLAEEEKLRHQRQYPDYRYQPRRGGKSGANGKVTPGAVGDDPGRCQKCGGRFIATPKKTNTPFSTSMLPAFAKPMAAGSPREPGGGGYMAPTSMMHNPNPRVIETDHLMRRGSNASMTSLDSVGRRYTQPYLRGVEEEYAMISHIAPPHKRQRYNDESAGIYMPTSPPMRYMSQPSDPEYSQQRPSISGPPISVSGYGPGPSSRPPHQQQQEQQNMYRPVHMQPPPRPTITYPQAAPVPTSVYSSGPGFDDSLRLPPLQTRIPGSPSMNSTASRVIATTTTQHAGIGAAEASQQVSSRRQSLPRSQSPQWLFRREMLCAISPPLKPPAPGSPPFEVRGPIIALEGASQSALKQVTAAVEKALAISGECAVKIWSGHDSQFRDGAESFQTPVAKFQARMLEWHRTSQELVEYITHPPLANFRKSLDTLGPDSRSTTLSPASGSSATNTVGTTTPIDGHTPSPIILPVAVLSNGYSLTVADREAAALDIADAYGREDHWRWVATMWRGIVGPDLTIYVKQCTEYELRASQVVEWAQACVLVVRVPDGKPNGDGDSLRVVDEKLERRLGFEIMEWVRGGQFERRSF